MSSLNGFAHNPDHYGFQTNAIHSGQEPEKWSSRTVVPPIVMGTTFKQYEPGKHAGFEYGRSGNPTRNSLEECLAPLEKAKYALAFASGSAALTTMSYLLKSGDHILTVDDVYGGTNRFFRNCANRMGIETSFVDMLDLELTEKSFKSNTMMVWIETPTNPTLKLVDIKAVCDLAKKKNPEVICVVDNTFASAYFQNPLELGADIVSHSLTKYMNGHSDVVMGAIMLNDEKLYERMKYLQNAVGAVPSPFDCFLASRGLKTLAFRMQAHMQNGLKVAKSLSENPRIEKVIYPGLESHPQHELYKSQMKGFGGMISIYIKGGIDESFRFLKELKLFACAESLGGYESLVEHPAIMTHASVPKDQRAILGIDDNFVRISVGLEDAEDLIGDLNQALEKAIPNV
ncbi:cystathionine gamma-lyase-like [Brachionus plicatilis]|uniref:cystathionine gamma-lyase n=4 Tax=Brachionus TaxID=10194 RepID=A0A3M7QNI7_BRAPC|nr:cystathionine gamma-lyase-like [Brachionus plicatilis]